MKKLIISLISILALTVGIFLPTVAKTGAVTAKADTASDYTIFASETITDITAIGEYKVLTPGDVIKDCYLVFDGTNNPSLKVGINTDAGNIMFQDSSNFYYGERLSDIDSISPIDNNSFTANKKSVGHAPIFLCIAVNGNFGTVTYINNDATKVYLLNSELNETDKVKEQKFYVSTDNKYTSIEFLNEETQYKKLEVGDVIEDCYLIIANAYSELGSAGVGINTFGDFAIYNYSSDIYFGEKKGTVSLEESIKMKTNLKYYSTISHKPGFIAVKIIGTFGKVSNIYYKDTESNVLVYLIPIEIESAEPETPGESVEPETPGESVEPETPGESVIESESKVDYLQDATDWVNSTLGLSLSAGALLLIIIVIFLIVKK